MFSPSRFISGKFLQRKLSVSFDSSRRILGWVPKGEVPITTDGSSANITTTATTSRFGKPCRSQPTLDSRLGKVGMISHLQVALGRFISTTPFVSMPLDEFRDPVPREKRMAEEVGRSWTVIMLQRKSYEDLHKLWYILYKERNMLLTEQNLCRRSTVTFPQPERLDKVKISMDNLKTVLNQRKKVKLNAVNWKREKDRNRALKLQKLAKAIKEKAAVKRQQENLSIEQQQNLLQAELVLPTLGPSSNETQIPKDDLNGPSADSNSTKSTAETNNELSEEEQVKANISLVGKESS